MHTYIDLLFANAATPLWLWIVNCDVTVPKRRTHINEAVQVQIRAGKYIIHIAKRNTYIYIHKYVCMYVCMYVHDFTVNYTNRYIYIYVNVPTYPQACWPILFSHNILNCCFFIVYFLFLLDRIFRGHSTFGAPLQCERCK